MTAGDVPGTSPKETLSPKPIGAIASPTAHSTVIRPSRGWVAINVREFWAYRELLFFLTWRDIKVRYKQTVLGAAWALLQPILTMVVFSVFFGRLAKMPSDGIPYPLFALAGLIPWQLFSYALSQSSNSVVANKNLVSKVYFPRLIVPLAAVLSGLVDFAIAFAVLLVMMFYYGFTPGPAIIAIPFAIVLTVMTALAIGSVAFGAQRALPRRAVHDSVPDAVLDVRDTDRVSGEPRPGAFSRSLRHQPDGRRRRVFSMGSVRSHWRIDVADRALERGHGDGVCGWRRLFSQGREDLRRSGVAPMAAAITARDVSKLYRLGHRERYGSLREVLTEARPRAVRGSPEAPRNALGAEGRRLRDRRAPGGRSHRPQRRRQEHAAQDPVAHHRADDGRDRLTGACGALLEVGTAFTPS